MKGFKNLKSILAMIMMCLCLTFAAVPAMEIHGATQTEQAAEGAADTKSSGSDEEGFFMIMMGGALLIILFAVISAMATVSSSVAVAANMDVDGE